MAPGGPILASKMGSYSGISVATETGGGSEIRLDHAQALFNTAFMNPHARALGRLGGLAGRGKPKARTSEQARAAAGVRWGRPVAAIPVPVAVAPVVREAREPLLKRSGKIL